MLGLILLYFVGKAYYDLAGKYQKNKWGFAILGVASYYVGLFLGGIIIGVIYEIFLLQSLDDVNDLLLGLMALPLGVLTCWGLYRILRNQWSKQPVYSVPDEILDADMGNRQPE